MARVLDTAELKVRIIRTIRLAVMQGMSFHDAFVKFAADKPNRDEVIDRLWWNMREAEYLMPPSTDEQLQMLHDCAERGNYDIGEVLYGAAHWMQTNVCHEHQTSSHRCGCLEDERRTHCFTCGSRKTSDGINLVCQLCDWEAFGNSVEEFPKCPNPECTSSRVGKSHVGFDYYCYGCCNTF